jgi:hypothetical protein
VAEETLVQTPANLAATAAAQAPTVPTTPVPPTGSPAPPTAPAEPAAPAAFDTKSLKMPEGFTADPASMEESSKVLPPGTDVKQAQALIDLYAKQVKASTERGQADWRTLQDTWQKEARNDPELAKLGGAQGFDGAIASVNNLMADPKFQTPGLVDALKITGAGNNPTVIKFLAKVSAALSEGKPAIGAPPKAQPSLAELMYPSMAKAG